MFGLPPNEHAAITEIATALAPAVTNSVIAEAASNFDLVSDKSNKVDKIRDIFATLWADGRRRQQAGRFAVGLAVEAHSRAVQGKVEFYLEDIDQVVQALRSLKLSASELSRGDWRNRLRKRVSEPSPSSVPTSNSTFASSATARVAPRRYDEALVLLGELTAGHVGPQHRGRQLEIILFGILKAEGLSPEHRVVSAGEEIDLAFTIDSHNYLVECKWEHDPLGLAPLRDFFGKVNSKAEGTFGVMLSMSGFVPDINEKASRGGRLATVGLSYTHLISILEGRTSWLATVQRARQQASRRSLFYSP